MLVSTYSSLWEGLDPALGFKKHLGKWKALSSIRLLKTLLLRGLSRVCTAARLCVCNLQGAGTGFPGGLVSLPGVSPCLAAPLWQPCQECWAPSSPQGACGAEGPAGSELLPGAFHPSRAQLSTGTEEPCP